MKHQELFDKIYIGKDKEAFLYLYKNLFPLVKRHIKKNSGSVSEAEDIFQDAILTVYEKVKMRDLVEDTNIEGYIFSVCKNAWTNKQKRKNNFNRIMDRELKYTDSYYDPEEVFLKEEQQELIYSVLAELGERCRELLIFSIYRKLSMKEIAEKMGLSNENVAKTSIYKCKQKLIDKVKQNVQLIEGLR